MGESIVGFPKDADKVGEIADSNPSNAALEVSVSFGRFENDSLSWEKWSTFSPNKYLEEVEKFATPGSVAQKRAYFEAHYRKIAAKKAEEMLEQEKQMEDDPLKSDEDQSGRDQISCGTHFEIDLTKSQSTAQGSNQEPNLDNEAISSYIDDLKEEDMFTIEWQQSSMIGREEEEADRRPASPKLVNSEEVVLVKEVENVPADSQVIEEIAKTLDNEIEKGQEVNEEMEGITRLHLQKGSQKVTPLRKERNVANVKKKPISPITKTPQKSGPRVSKSISTPTPRVSKSPSTSIPRVSKSVSSSTPRVAKSMSTATPASRSSEKKGICSSLPRSNKPSIKETKKTPPKPLHLSPSLDTTKSDSPSVTTTRKSFIMENMGDKDIVKRAFKTFQNNFNEPKSSAEERSSTPKQLSTKGKESRVSSSAPPTKENGRLLKMGALEKRSAKAAPSSFGLSSDERTEKKKEFSKKMEAKFNTKEAEIKKLRQSVDFKATPTPGLHRGQKIAKVTSEKESSKKETHR